MENKEIKRITRLESHDCNECEKCQESIKNYSNNWCSACHFIFFEKLYQDFSSSNKVVDEMIKNPIYIPPNKNNQNCDDVLYYEWIPWERLSNINQIAKGGLGIIYKATLIDGIIAPWSIKHYGSMKYKRRGTQEVAIKIIKTNSEEVFKELNIRRAISISDDYKYENNISYIYGITQNAETHEYGIVMPFAKLGDMRKYLSTNFHSTSWIDKIWIAGNIAEGLKQIHTCGMVHRDLHSGNILQFNEDEVKIGDLGLCQPVKNEATTTTEEKKIYGVIPYIPPEVLRGENFTTAGDIYSYGMLLWELSTGKPPFYEYKHDHILIMAILNGQRPKITSPLIPPCIVEIIVKCWDPNPKNRPTVEEVRYKIWELKSKYSRMKTDVYKDEELIAGGFVYQESADEESGVWKFSYVESKTVGLLFRESDKYVKEMAESDDSTTTNQSTTTMTTTTTRIHPGAVYTSRVLTLQMFQETKG
ncbi:hypothetical protein G9A89_008421 [Geosiphon pyriformis]|nr:hypothetical protein G9A89_008421 [Geosiphon pyriformis]